LLQPAISSSGWSLDLVWCNYCGARYNVGTNSCAVVDVTGFKHIHFKTASSNNRKNYNPTHEENYYHINFEKYWTCYDCITKTVPLNSLAINSIENA